jgi:colicin import membrane protein
MSLIANVVNAMKRKNQTAREKYLAALRDGDAERIAVAAQAAGVAVEEVEADVGILEKAAALAAEANKLPEAERAAAEAAKRLEAAEARLRKVVEPLEQAANAASFEAVRAAEEVRRLRPIVDELSVLHRDRSDLLPPASKPEAVAARDTAEGDRIAADAAAAARLHRLRAAEAALGRAEGELQHVRGRNWLFDIPGSVDATERAQLLNRRGEFVAKAEADVKAAKCEVEAAEREVAAQP